MAKHFELICRDTGTKARRGRLRTLHGAIETPVFMPVGTQGTVKALTPEQIKSAGAQIILGNTYHLNLRPGSELVKELGGLHKFMGWNGPILTDSGGFQVFSLSELRNVTETGITFRSHIDGSKVFLGPREVMNIQRNLGSDIAMVLDECPPWPPQRDVVEAAVERSIRWAAACLDEAKGSGFLDEGHHVFAIVQGSTYEDLRSHCARELAGMGFSGYAVGGVSVGEPETEMIKAVRASEPHMPEELPRYVMGVGTPPQLLKMIGMGMDMFDCVMPTREARHGIAYTPTGKINIKNARFRNDPSPLSLEHDNYTCRNFSRAYLRHLFVAGEMLAATLLTLHNVNFFLDLLDQARAHIECGDFEKWHLAWSERYLNGEADRA